MSQTLVGREAELATLSDFIDDVGNGPSALLLEGEAGIGKTTLWQAGLTLASGRASLRVLTSQPAESEAALSFSALGDLLGAVADEILPELPELQRRSLEAALLLREGPASDVDHRAVSLALLGAIRALTESTPLILTIDDIQWMDRPTARALEFAMRRLKGESLSLLAAARAPKGSPTPLGLDRALAAERLLHLWVGPLSLGAIHQLLRTRLGISLPRPTLVRLYEASGGNPFFALEIARSILELEEPPRAGEALPLPANLHALVADRMKRLSDSVTYVLLIVSMAPHATVDLVSRARGDIDDALRGLTEASRAGVVEVVGERIRFTHPLLASTLLSDAGLEDVRRAHLALAGAVSDPESRARHLALATDSADQDVAIALENAASHARARGAPETAGELGELAISRTPEHRIDDVIRRKIAAAADLLEAGETARGKRLLEEVQQAAPPGPRRSAALWRLADLSEDDPGIRTGLLTQALEEAGADHALRSSILSRMSTWASDDLPRAESHARLALEEAELAGDLDLQAGAIASLISWLGVQGHEIQDVVRDRALELERLADRAPVYESPGLWLGILRMCRSDLEAARLLLDAALERAIARGNELGISGIQFHMTELECRAGNFAQAATHAREGFERAEQAGLEQEIGGSLFGVAIAEAHLGNVEAAREAATKGLAIAMRLGDRIFEIQHRRALGFLELSLGRPAEAERSLAPAPELLRSMGVGEPGIFLFPPDLIESLVAVGELGRAEEQLTKFESRARELEHPWATATGLRCRALLLAAESDQRGAIEAIEEGLAAHERIPEPFELGRMRLVAGTIHRRFKHKRLARESLQAALETFERLGTPLWADKATAELARIGLRAAEPGGLTPTEERVAELVVAGHTNREIADELFLSLRTVEANLTRIYRKLAVRSRTELVRLRSEANRAG